MLSPVSIMPRGGTPGWTEATAVRFPALIPSTYNTPKELMRPTSYIDKFCRQWPGRIQHVNLTRKAEKTMTASIRATLLGRTDKKDDCG
jgi:hypothetical protein